MVMVMVMVTVMLMLMVMVMVMVMTSHRLDDSACDRRRLPYTPIHTRARFQLVFTHSVI